MRPLIAALLVAGLLGASGAAAGADDDVLNGGPKFDSCLNGESVSKCEN